MIVSEKPVTDENMVTTTTLQLADCWRAKSPFRRLETRLGSTGKRKAHPPKEFSRPTQFLNEVWNDSCDGRDAH